MYLKLAVFMTVEAEAVIMKFKISDNSYPLVTDI
jgi:hypothetical protein